MNPADFDPTESHNTTFWKAATRRYRAWFQIALALDVVILIIMVWLLASHTGGNC